MTNQPLKLTPDATTADQPMLHSATDVKVAVDSVLQEFFAQQVKRASKLNDRYRRLWKATSRVILADGKRLRPYFVVLAYESYGGKDFQAVLKVATAQELLHSALLVHDDIADRDYIRHGVPNVAGVYQKLFAVPGRPSADVDHFANIAALHAGDLLLSAAHIQLASAGFDPQIVVALQQQLGERIFEVAAGQQMDVEAVLEPPASVDPLQIARLKTAGYSFVGPFCSGAILAGVATDEMKKLQTVGYAMGIAFQLVDDLLGVFGDEQLTGKSASNDIREGKRTVLAALAFERSNASQRWFLEAHYGNPDLQPDQAATIREIFRTTGARQAVGDMADQYADQTRSAIASLAIPLTARQQFEACIDKVTKRDH